MPVKDMAGDLFGTGKVVFEAKSSGDYYALGYIAGAQAVEIGITAGAAKGASAVTKSLKGTTTAAKGVSTSAKTTSAAKGGNGGSVKFGSDTKSAAKLSNQMTQRGWTESSVRNTVSNPYIIRTSTNMATGNSATVYYTEAGSYVIIDDVTKAVVQISDNINSSTWIPDPNITNPYKP